MHLWQTPRCYSCIGVFVSEEFLLFLLMHPVQQLVPYYSFILAISLGLSKIKGGKHSEENSLDLSCHECRAYTGYYADVYTIRAKGIYTVMPANILLQKV